MKQRSRFRISDLTERKYLKYRNPELQGKYLLGAWIEHVSSEDYMFSGKWSRVADFLTALEKANNGELKAFTPEQMFSVIYGNVAKRNGIKIKVS